jgi:glycosyltransferase involved in cell wall biosynthesis
MDISLILCTYNRSESLPKALDSVAAQILPESILWEVIVVDNNSRDQTRAVVDDYCRRFPGRFRYLLEIQQGLSRARNAGIQQAMGEIIAFIDDDVVADPNWLQNLTASLRDGQWAGAGGKIVPPKDFHPPKWLTVGGKFDLGGTLALYDNGDLSGHITRAPFGTNMAFRKETFRKYGMFRTDLGRCGNVLLSGEDTEFGERLFRAGERLRYEANAVVHHPVPQERLQREYFETWWFDFGRTRIIERASRPPFLGIPRECISILRLVLLLLPVRALNWLLTLETKKRFYLYCQVWMTLGEVVQNLRKIRTPAGERNAASTNPGNGSQTIGEGRTLS